MAGASSATPGAPQRQTAAPTPPASEPAQKETKRGSMYCRQCQAFLGGTAFCPKCGAVLQTEQQIVDPDTFKEQAGGFTEVEHARFDVIWDRFAPWMFKRIPLFILLVVVVIVVLYFTDNSGQEMWKIEPKGLNHFLAVEANDETAFLLITDGSLAAIRAEDGTEIWTTQFGAGSKYVQSLVLDDAHLIVALPELLTCLSSTDGRVLWNCRYSRTRFVRY
jgi:hypothetical protein